MDPKKYNCLVVDDEPIARKIIINYISQLPLLTMAAEHINALDAIDFLRTGREVDIIFLDIDMPNLSGLQLVKIVQPHQPVIFTTAYPQFAVESYELNGVDYLLKPFSFERFTKAVYKSIDVLNQYSRKRADAPQEKRPDLFVKSDGKQYPVMVDDILFCEARKNYTMVVLKNDHKLMPLIPLSKFENLLLEAGGQFCQIHRSFLVAKKHITAVTPGSVMIGKFELPIGVQFKERFFTAMGMKHN